MIPKASGVLKGAIGFWEKQKQWYYKTGVGALENVHACMKLQLASSPWKGGESIDDPKWYIQLCGDVAFRLKFNLR